MAHMELTVRGSSSQVETAVARALQHRGVIVTSAAVPDTDNQFVLSFPMLPNNAGPVRMVAHGAGLQVLGQRIVE